MDFGIRISRFGLGKELLSQAPKVAFALSLALALGGCSQSATDTQSGGSSAPSNQAKATDAGSAATTGGTSSAPGSATSETSVPPAGTGSADDPQTRKPKDGDEVAVMDTSLGRIVLMFFPDKAPKHVENFKKLAKSGFYNGTKFHRVIPDFMIQGGDPNTKKGDVSTWGQGGPGYSINAEFNDVKHERGILSMARSSDPDSAGSQFFIMVKYTQSLDGQYSAFGKVVSGMETVDKIVNLPRGENDRPNQPPVIKSLKIVKWPVK